MGNITLENSIIDIIKTIYDPEIPVDVYELGLIYEVKINADQSVDVEMTLTSPNCPAPPDCFLCLYSARALLVIVSR